MNPSKFTRFTRPLVALSATLLATPAVADEDLQSKVVVKVATDGAEVIEADVSNLELGESESFVTESGRTVDILRVPEGIELYIDGELVETGTGAEHLEKHMAIHEELLHSACSEDEAACNELLEELDIDVMVDGDLDTDNDVNVIVARHRVESVCDEDGNCEESVWIEEDGDVILESLHEDVHVGEGGHRVIVIRKELHTDSD